MCGSLAEDITALASSVGIVASDTIVEVVLSRAVEVFVVAVVRTKREMVWVTPRLSA